MLPALALAPLTLAAVLVLSGLAKLRDPGSTASMIALLRLPAVLRHRLVPRALPVVELVTAALLLTPWPWTYAVGAALALALFTAFLVVIARAMSFEPRPTCGCFGRVGDHRVNGRTVGRNVLLVALALVTAWLALAGRPAGAVLAGWTTGDLTWLVMAAALATVAVLVLGGGPATAPTRHRHDRAATSSTPDDEALDYVRRPIPGAFLLSRELEVVHLRPLAARQAQLLVLVNCWCGTTFAAAERLAGWRQALPQLGVQLVHTRRPWDEVRLQGLEGLWWDPGAAASTALGVAGSPAAVLLGADGLLAGGPVHGVEDIEDLVAQVAEQLLEAPSADLPTT